MSSPSTPVSSNLRPPTTPLPAPPRDQTQPRRQYVELKANVHRKLLGRLNLEALASADRSRAEGEIRALLGRVSQYEIARRYGITQANVSCIKRGVSWRP